jgi:SAM-dependent methyltransferase
VTALDVALRTTGGEIVDGRRWALDADDVDERVLARVDGPAIDIGCGPGRHVVALAERGVVVLGIDVTSAAVVAARTRGVAALRRDVFDHVPAHGRWGTALLFDGNLGIGADPVALLRRVRRLLRRDGSALVELDGPGTRREPYTVRLELDGAHGPWFQWAHVAADEIGTVAALAGFRAGTAWCDTGRWFCRLVRR